MAKNVKVEKVYKGTRKNRFGLRRPRLKSMKKTTIKNPKNPNIKDILDSLPGKDRIKAYKSYVRGKATEVGSTAASAATTGISVGKGMTSNIVDTSSLGNLSQNVQGGISQSADHRDDDEEDYPGVN